MINEALDSGNAEIGKIEVLKKFSFFEIEESVEKKLLKVLKGQEFEGIPLAIEIASQEKPKYAGQSKTKSSRDGSFSKRRFGKRSDRDRNKGGGKGRRNRK